MAKQKKQGNAGKTASNLTIETGSNLPKSKEYSHSTMAIRSNTTASHPAASKPTTFHPTASHPTASHLTASTPTASVPTASVPTASAHTAKTSVAPCQRPYLIWNGTPFTINECRLACALAIHVCFEDTTPLDHVTMGRVIGATKGLKEMDCEDLVEHLRETNDVYPVVASGDHRWGDWAQNAWNMWLDPRAAPFGSWP